MYLNLTADLNKVILNLADKKCVIVLKGFPLKFVFKFISENTKDIFLLNNKEITYTEEKIDLSKIEKNKQALIKKLLSISENKFLLIFEEFYSLNNIIDFSIFDYNFYIIENNFFYEVPNQCTESFIDFEQEIDKNNYDFNENEIFNIFYSNSITKNDFNFLQYKDFSFENYKNVKILKFFNKELLGNIKLNEVIKYFDIDKNYDKLNNFIEFPLTDTQDDKEYTNLKLKIFFDNKIDETNIILNKALLDNANNRFLEELEILIFLFKRSSITLNIYYRKVEIEVDKPREAFREILYEYWNSNNFRDLVFYKNPDLNKEKITISQSSLIEFIVKNCEKAHKSDDSHDIYITAPTGSGKSILFQIPAVYIAKEYNLVTIIVTPLKALMYDQVTALNKRGIKNATYINSDISLMERERIIEKIKSGIISLLYLSPELLLSYDLRFFIGERKLGLLVIDESHLVTTWGRDFRVDYWYLGTYIQKIRKYNDYNFPVLALTATAVYQGPDDIVFETIASLNMKNVEYFIGNVVREEIGFKIKKFEYKGNHEISKLENTLAVILRSIKDKKKTIVYFPWTRQVEMLIRELPEKYLSKVARYYGNVSAEEKMIAADDFKSGKVLIVLATKAFGMGVDVQDIEIIYHHAPSGNLTDYVQEIGRVARDKRIKGYAEVDFCKKDLKFTKILYGLSSIKQYQLNIVLEKLYDLYVMKNQKRNMLVSPEDFGFIFYSSFNKLDELENKVKSALLLLEKDMVKKYRYNIVIVRPKNLYSIVYACILGEIESDFKKVYGEHIKFLKSAKDNFREGIGNVISSDLGNIYEIRLDKIWEQFFPKDSFPVVKKKFFDKELFGQFAKYVYPRYRLTVKLKHNKNDTLNKLIYYFDVLNTVFNSFGTKLFDRNELESRLYYNFKDRYMAKRISNLLLNLYTTYNGNNEGFNRLYFDNFIQARNVEGKHEIHFRVINTAFDTVKHYTIKKFNLMFRGNNNLLDKFITVNDEDREFRVKIAFVLESFALGSYELSGGKLPQIFVRINDPFKIKTLIVKGNYSNDILRDIEERHERGVEIMDKFFSSDFTDKERWDFIEDYFLGHDVV